MICTLRGGWFDPWKPWLPAGLALTVAVFLGAIALRTCLVGYAAASGLAVNLAAVFVWIAWGPDTLSGFLLANAAGLAAAGVVWTLVRIRQARPEEEAWLGVVDFVPVAALALLALGLLVRRLLSGGEAPARGRSVVGCDQWPSRSRPLSGSGTGVRSSRGRCFTPLGCSTVLSAAAIADRPLAVWDTALAPDGAGRPRAWSCGKLGVVVTRRAKTALEHAGERPNGGRYPRRRGGIAVAVAMFSARIGLLAPSIWERLEQVRLAVICSAPAFMRFWAQHCRARAGAARDAGVRGGIPGTRSRRALAVGRARPRRTLVRVAAPAMRVAVRRGQVVRGRRGNATSATAQARSWRKLARGRCANRRRAGSRVAAGALGAVREPAPASAGVRPDASTCMPRTPLTREESLADARLAIAKGHVTDVHGCGSR